MNAWANFIGYQIAWFIVVGSAARDRAWIGLGAAGAFVLVQLCLSTRRSVDLRLIAAALVAGVSVDGALSALGWLRYADPTPALPPGGAPLWILALWSAFALTLTRSLAWLRPYPWLAAAFGAAGGPLAYWSAARGFGAVAFAAPEERAILGLAVGWSLAISALFYLTRRWFPAARTALPVAAEGAPPPREVPTR